MFEVKIKYYLADEQIMVINHLDNLSRYVMNAVMGYSDDNELGDLDYEDIISEISVYPVSKV